MAPYRGGLQDCQTPLWGVHCGLGRRAGTHLPTSHHEGKRVREHEGRLSLWQWESEVPASLTGLPLFSSLIYRKVLLALLCFFPGPYCPSRALFRPAVSCPHRIVFGAWLRGEVLFCHHIFILSREFLWIISCLPNLFLLSIFEAVFLVYSYLSDPIYFPYSGNTSNYLACWQPLSYFF